MKRLYFIRHGESVYNQIGKFSGRQNVPLTNEGREEVKKTAETIKKLGIETIVSSPLNRAIESAHIIATILDYPFNKILVNNLFSERDLGELEGRRYQSLADDDDEEDENIEEVDSLIERARKGYKWLSSLETDTILLVSHESLGKALSFVISQKHATNQSKEFKNAEVITLI
jgi:broad specificity phosphatase PhoE